VWAIKEADGKTAWHNSAIESYCTAAYDPDTNSLFVAASNGRLYKLNPSNGSVEDSFQADSGLNLAPVIATGKVYVVSDAGVLYAVNRNTMDQVWSYAAGSPGQTPVAYSGQYDVLIYGTQNLYVHAVNNADGSSRWTRKPTVNQPGSYSYDGGDGRSYRSYNYEHGWPVVAEDHGIVFMRLRLPKSAMWQVPPSLSWFPTSNASIRSFLVSNPGLQTLFALSLDDGDEVFVPAVGTGGAETPDKDNTLGPLPVVKRVGGDEVVYTMWRNGQKCEAGDCSDPRWDAVMGEMMLDSTTVPGYQAGDCRFVDFHSNHDSVITDEMGKMSMAGQTLFHSHWLAMYAYSITDRRDSYGATYANPIRTEQRMSVVNRASNEPEWVNCQPTAGHYCNGFMDTHGDRRVFPAGFWAFFNDFDPPYQGCTSHNCVAPYSDGYKARYTIVNNGTIYYELNGGTIIALRSSGSGVPPAELTVQAEPTALTRGESVTYNLYIQGNSLPLVLTNRLPDGLGAPGSVSASSGGATYDSGQHLVRWTGTPEFGQQVTIEYEAIVQVDGPAVLVNEATVTDDEGRSATSGTTVIVDAYESYVPLVVLGQPGPPPDNLVLNLTDNRDAYSDSLVPRYHKFELSFDLSRAYPNPYYYYDPEDTPESDPDRQSPYGADGVSIDAHFVSPSDGVQTVPAFWYQDYDRWRESERERMSEADDPMWKVRFTPSEVGLYRYYLTIHDKQGQARYPNQGYLTFESAPSGSSGFIRGNAEDRRFLAYDDGTPYIGISEGLQYWSAGGGLHLKSYFYEDRFDLFSQHGINLTRIWTQCDGDDGCWALCLEGNEPSGTWMDQENAYRFDRIVEAAEHNGIALLVSSVGNVNGAWDVTDWTDPRYLDYWKRNFRYRVARYGYSTSILAWETWNEHGHIEVGGHIYDFYQAYGPYQEQTDPYHHLRTTGQGSQVWDPATWSSPAFDMATYHDYAMPSRYPPDLVNDVTNFVHRFSQCLRNEDLDYSLGSCGLNLRSGTTWVGGPRPWVWAEFGIGTDVWNEPNPAGNSGEGGRRATHNRLWAGLFSPLGTAPIEWYWYYQDNDAEWYQQKLDETRIAREFFDIDYTGVTFLASDDVNVPNYVGETISTSTADLRVLAIRPAGGQGAYAWVQNRDHTWVNADTTPGPVSGSFVLPGISPGQYRVERWNTMTGEVTVDPGTIAPDAQGDLTVQIQNLRRDQAIKILPAESQATSEPGIDPGSGPGCCSWQATAFTVTAWMSAASWPRGSGPGSVRAPRFSSAAKADDTADSHVGHRS
jgi:outer membrane protein assembly factor BamB